MNNIKEMNPEQVKDELQQEEVNVYAGCTTTLKIHCMSDCFGTNDAWLSTYK